MLSAWSPLIPVALSSPSAPTASVLPSPLTAIGVAERFGALPSGSPVFDALMYACCDHVLPLRVKHVHRPGLGNRIVGLVAVDPGRRAGLVLGGDRQRVAVGAQGDRRPELIVRVRIRRLDVGLLRHRSPLRVYTYTAPELAIGGVVPVSLRR